MAPIASRVGRLDRQNKASLGRLVTHGGLAYAEEGPDGRLRAQIRILPDELIWDPAVLIMPHGILGGSHGDALFVFALPKDQLRSGRRGGVGHGICCRSR
ncbi:hypothetical protein MOQ72_37890 [Saccharopolyspora sp. K220]|uniref:hypothetical protein n=1 Tax=Saccharopolyspora soli TaxID=2926618 RepID=UPI001F55C931|nr:hypothetical protein [Saccharopolyspora soli]MCI2423207.1 hypothetical protein [Saccharopolyspora soli]